ncbi:MAG: hypothetical protein E7241_03230 [Lachnospiraceae bacterium]|jgi:flagellin|nr:hypothetical protein [Lachnospiraceae bacterium]
MRINYNLSAMLTNSQLLRNERNQQSAAERLASGLRINHAKDDPAGMAISNKMDVQINGLKQASRNSSDAISVIETADSSLNEVTSILQRMRELSVQAANDSNGLEDREAIQAEINTLTAEIDRVSRNTEFNKKILLDGSLSRRAYTDNRNIEVTAVGDGVPTDKYGITLNSDARQAVLLGKNGTGSGFDADGKIKAEAAGQIDINGVLINIDEGDTAEIVYQKIRDGAELGDVYCIPTNQPPTFDGKNETTAGYEATPGIYDPTTSKLVFVSKDYGSAEKFDIKINNAILADTLGLANKMYDAGTAVTYAQVMGVRGSTMLLPDKTNPDEESPFLDKSDSIPTELTGTITVSNGTATATATINVGDKASEVYEKLQTACDAVGITTSLTYEENKTDFAATGDTFSYGQAIVFKQTVLGAIVQVDCDNPALARTMGIMTTKASVEGLDADASFTMSGGKRVGYANSATINEVGEKITVSDKNGFELEMTMVRKACATDYTDVTIDTVNTSKHAEKTNPAITTSIDVVADVTGIGTMTVHVGANENQIMEIDIPEISAKRLEIDKLNVRSGYGADKALASVDKALSRVTEVRSRLGAYQNRLEHTVASLNASDEDVTSAVSRIRDIDMAAETTEYTQHTILVQAATSVLAQANDLPQQALQLIQ